jgi:hypothetical protein
MKKNIICCIIIFYGIFFSCCKNDFTPYGEFEEKLVVYAILDSRLPDHIVKVQRSFFYESDTNYKSKIPNNIKVTISNSTGTYTLKDTTIEGVTNYAVFCLSDHIIGRGDDYSIRVTADDYLPATASIISPVDRSINLIINNLNVVAYWGSTNENAAGHAYHMYIYYNVIDGNKIDSQRIEVPNELIINDIDTTFIYPELSSAITTTYYNNTISYTLSKIRTLYPDEQVIIKKCMIIILSFDENLYSYYYSIQRFNDPYSLRLDAPFYSNINNGYGVFGVVTTDSNTIWIPGSWITGEGLINGQ